jgi:hypothetical protein
MLRRVANVLHARLRIVFEPEETKTRTQIAESRASYGTKRAKAKRS